MAEWVAFSTLERLGLDTVAWRRRRALAGVLEHATLIRAGLDLETHGTPQGFASWRQREGTLPTYQLAFLMADYLIERRGLVGVEAYFRSFSSSRDRNKNFALAFGTTLAEFEKDMLSHVVAAPAAGPPSDQRQVARTPRAAHCPGSVPQPAVELWMNGTCMRKKLGHPGPQLLGT